MASTAIIYLCQGLLSLLEQNESPAGILLKSAIKTFITQETSPAPPTLSLQTSLSTDDHPISPDDHQTPLLADGQATVSVDLSLSIIQGTPQPPCQRRQYFNQRSRSPQTESLRDSQNVYTTITVQNIPILTAGDGIQNTVDPRIGEGVISIAAAIAPVPIIVIESENDNEKDNDDAHAHGEEDRLLVPGNRGQQPRDQGRKDKSAIWERKTKEHIERRKRELIEERKTRMEMCRRWR